MFEEVQETRDDSEEQLVFHYNREERIKKAPRIVQDYYSGKIKGGGPGLIKALVATKANRFIFFAIVVFAAVIFWQSWFGNKNNKKNVEGIPLELVVSEIDDYARVLIKFGENLPKYDYSQGTDISGQIHYLDENRDEIKSEEISLNYCGDKIWIKTECSSYGIIKIVHVDLHFLNKNVDLESRIEVR